MTSIIMASSMDSLSRTGKSKRRGSNSGFGAALMCVTGVSSSTSTATKRWVEPSTFILRHKP